MRIPYHCAKAGKAGRMKTGRMTEAAHIPRVSMWTKAGSLRYFFGRKRENAIFKANISPVKAMQSSKAYRERISGIPASRRNG